MLRITPTYEGFLRQTPFGAELQLGPVEWKLLNVR